MRTLLALFLFAVNAFGQSNSGELRLKIVDPAGLGLRSFVEITSDANQFRQRFVTDEAGYLIARNLPFGIYSLRVTRHGFATHSSTFEVRSAIAVVLRVMLAVATSETSVDVTDSSTLIDPHRTGTANRIGSDVIEHRSTVIAGRSVIDLVDSQPGWVIESNGVLHPRGSEYQTQYVIDGVPLTDNRSPSFAPEIEADVPSESSVSSSIGRLPIMCFRVSPSRNSITMNDRPLCRPISCITQILGWLRAEAACASRWKRAKACES